MGFIWYITNRIKRAFGEWVGSSPAIVLVLIVLITLIVIHYFYEKVKEAKMKQKQTCTDISTNLKTILRSTLETMWTIGTGTVATMVTALFHSKSRQLKVGFFLS